MTLLDTVEAYNGWRRAHGAKFIISAWVLRMFSKHVGDGIDCDAVGESDVVRQANWQWIFGESPIE